MTRWTVRVVGALCAAVAVVACGGSQPDTEVLLRVRGSEVVVTGPADSPCVEIVGVGGGASFCADDEPGAVWLASAATDVDSILIGQAPPEVASITLADDQGTRTLQVEESAFGRFFVAPRLPSGGYEMEARRADGSLYLSGTVVPLGGATQSTFLP